MASIRDIRKTTPFDPGFVARHPLLWPLQAAARVFQDATDWPAVGTWSAALGEGAPPVGFTVAKPRPRSWRRPRTVEPYDASIVDNGLVPSREQNWHDFLNALVWATFPQAKAALHRRQRAMLAARPPANRTREGDGLAMIDEGGVLSLVDAGAAPDGELRLVFGHALYEGFVLGIRRQTARLIRLPVAGLGSDPIAQADAALAARLADPAWSTHPGSLPRDHVPDAAIAPWMPPI